MNPEQVEELPDMSAERQLEAMGLTSVVEEPTGVAALQQDLPDMPAEKQLEVMGLTTAAETATTAQPATQVMPAEAAGPAAEPEMEAYLADQVRPPS